jgi:hypothetical protein
MQPWIAREKLYKKELHLDVDVLEITRDVRKIIGELIDDYVFYSGKMRWAVADIPKLQAILKSVLGLSDDEFSNIIQDRKPDDLRRFVTSKTVGFIGQDIDEICNVLTKEASNNAGN